MKWLWVIGVLGCCGNAGAASLGVVGSVFPVEEESFLMLIESRLKTMSETGELHRLEASWVNEAEAYSKRPTPIGLTRADAHHIHRHVPAVVLQQDIKNEKGEVIFHQGTKVNALKALATYEPHWLFFNADDKAQVLWAHQQLKKLGDARIILVGGDVSGMEALFNQPIYFDQAGRITRQLGINAVPALVSRDKNALLIREVAITEDGYAR